MKSSFAILILSFLSTAAFGQTDLNCSFFINDNKVDCPIIGSCPQSVLKSSGYQLDLQLHDGDKVEGEIKLKNVVLFPGTKKENDNRITVFDWDKREEDLRDKKNVDLYTYDSKSSIKYTAEKFGSKVSIDLVSPSYNLNIELENASHSAMFPLLPSNVLIVKCQSLKGQINSEKKDKEIAYKKYLEQKKAKSAASKQ